MKDSNISKLIKQAKSSKSTNQIQKMIPVKKHIRDEVQFSFYIDKNLLKSLKIKAIEMNVSIKHLINKSIFEYLENGK